MTLATLLRYSDSKKGKVWDKSYVIGHAYHTLGEKFGIGVMAVMSEAAIDEAVKMCDGFILPGSSINIDPSYWGEAPFDPPEIMDEYAFDRKMIDAFVYDVFGTTRALVNCHHSWELGKVAPIFRVVASTDDGVIEAIECREKNIYATQWHPELSLDGHWPEIEHKFFENFLRRCEECKTK